MNAKLTGSQIKTGMRLGGREITKVRHGAGSSKAWTYLTFATPDANDSVDGRVRRNTVRVEVEIPA